MKYLINSRAFDRTADTPTGFLASTMTFNRPSLVYKLVLNSTIGGGTTGTSRVFWVLGNNEGDTFNWESQSGILACHNFYNDDAAATIVLPQETIIDFEENPLEVDSNSPIKAYVFGAPGSNVYAVASYSAYYTLASFGRTEPVRPHPYQIMSGRV